jgi:hypothetical protein
VWKRVYLMQVSVSVETCVSDAGISLLRKALACQISFTKLSEKLETLPRNIRNMSDM